MPQQTLLMIVNPRAGRNKSPAPLFDAAAIFCESGYLLSIPRTAPEYLVAHRLLKVLHYFLPVDGDVMDEIPPLSILREFIGECSFYDMH